jgi:hypothetical protein
MNKWDGIMLTGPFLIMAIWALSFKFILHVEKLGDPVYILLLAAFILTFELLMGAVAYMEDW